MRRRILRRLFLRRRRKVMPLAKRLSWRERRPAPRRLDRSRCATTRPTSVRREFCLVGVSEPSLFDLMRLTTCAVTALCFALAASSLSVTLANSPTAEVRGSDEVVVVDELAELAEAPESASERDLVRDSCVSTTAARRLVTSASFLATAVRSADEDEDAADEDELELAADEDVVEFELDVFVVAARASRCQSTCFKSFKFCCTNAEIDTSL
mmetsp:Transcript_28207/g.43449  ORF Transcript_28207/g.43449 Transcript_28207/m.43449 type:complete len:212 (-) Transcript_28207:99-734(-)